MIRPCKKEDFDTIYFIINDAAKVYKGVIPQDMWKEPYMSKDELKKEIEHGVRFWGYEEGKELVGVMGIQNVKDVTLIRHTYVKRKSQRKGIGSRLLLKLLGMTTKPVLIGTWKDAKWAISFYMKHGFRLVSEEEKDVLLKKYWNVPERQIETSVVLADEKWFKKKSKGYVHVYTGDGKGKTTAALGLAIRAAGYGMKVFIGQFLKSDEYSEHKALARFSDLIKIKQYGRGCFIYEKPEEEDIKVARKGLHEIKDIINSGEYDLVILDEANIAVYYNLFSVDELLEIIRSRPEHVEIVITGRMADKRLIDEADLVTEMKEIKHYYKKGVPARFGIEK